MAKVTLNPLTPDDREQFIRENQGAFNYGALEEFGLRDDHFEEDGEIISHETIEQAIDGGEAYRMNDKAVMQAYGFDIKNTSEADCVAHLMRMYQELTKDK